MGGLALGARRILWGLVVFVVVVVIGLPLLLMPLLPRRQAAPASPPASIPRALLQQGELPIALYLDKEGRVAMLPLEEYLKGVVAAEMPASFEKEALKAQAVVARTYVVGRMRVFGGPGCPDRPEADVCTDPGKGQAWHSREELRQRWGAWRFGANWRRVEEAVEATRGLIVTYENRPIDAVYHASAGGRTEAARHVWGSAVPYLQSVSSPDATGNRYERVVTHLTWDRLARQAGVEAGALEAARREGKEPVAILEGSESGRVIRARVGDRLFTGPELRRALGLPSTLFTWRVEGDGLTIVNRGYGHGVGLSQYGANGLARQGRDFRAIILHYYAGVTLRPLFEE